MAQVNITRSFTQQYWRALLPELLVLLLLGIVAGLVGWGWLQHYQAHLQAVLTQRLTQQAHTMALQQAHAYQQLLALHHADVERWQAAGLLRADLIPHWVETWPAVARAQGLVDVRYQFLPPHACQPADWPVSRLGCPQLSEPKPLALQVSRMTVNFSLNHEAQLMPWLHAIQTQYAGATILRHCDFSADHAQATVEVVCELHWFHLPMTLPDMPALEATS